MCRLVGMFFLLCFYVICCINKVSCVKLEALIRNNGRIKNENAENKKLSEIGQESPRFHRNIHQNLETTLLYGFEETSSIPVNFPYDICLVNLDSVEYAVALHPEIQKDAQSNVTLLSFFRKNAANDYEIFHTHKSPEEMKMDCVALDTQAFVAVVIDVQDPTFNKGSPIFRICNDEGISIIQYVATPHQNSVHLQRDGDDLFMFYTFKSPMDSSENLCPIYRLSDYHFDLIDELPCTNAIRIEPFVISSDVYIAVANYKDKLGNLETFSEIYKLNLTTDKFYLLQKLKTHAVVDVKYFHLMISGQREHFFVLANSLERDSQGNLSQDANSIIYKLSNGYFVPFQSILLYTVKQFLPVLGPNEEFSLLISCYNQPTRAYQYDGWKFDDSEVQFTGGTLSKGVTNMRTYKTKNATAVVVSNPMVITDAINVFVPIYTKRDDLKQQYDKYNDWCRINCDKFLDVDVKAIWENINEAATLRDGSLTLDGNITLRSVQGRNVQTKMLQTPSVYFDDSLISLLELANKSLEKLQSRLQALTSARSSLPISDVFVKETYNQLAVDDQMHFSEFKVTNNLTVKNINGRPISSLVYTDRDLELSELRTNNLILNAGLTSHGNQVLGAAPNSVDIESLTVSRLKVLGNINEINAGNLIVNALRTSGDQLINGEMRIKHLEVNEFNPQNEVALQNVDKMVRIDAGTYSIDQDVQFGNVLRAGTVNISTRINHVRVFNQQLDVLLTDSPFEQTITGNIQFESATLIEPIILQGKIKSHNLAKMNPISSIDENLKLRGDFTIKGRVTVNRRMIADNLFGPSETESVQLLRADGLKLNANMTDIDVEFLQTINVEHLAAGAVNQVDPSTFLRYTEDEVQVVKGRKTFVTNLHVPFGACEAKEINQVDISQLNATVLKTNVPQTIGGKIHFNRITVERLGSNSTHLNGAVLSNYWGDWPHAHSVEKITINGSVTVSGAFNVNRLHSNALIFGQRLSDLLRDSATSDGDNVFVGRRSFEGPINAKRLVLQGKLWGNDVFYWNTSLNNVGREAVFNGPLKLDGKINVKQLTVDNMINSIDAKDFTNKWMLTESTQVLKHKLNIENLIAEETLYLEGQLNGHMFMDLVQKTIRIDQPQTLGNVYFDHLVSHNDITINGFLSGLKIPEDILLRKFNGKQTILGNLEISNDVSVNGPLVTPGWIDRIDRLCQYCNVTATQDRTIIVKGDIELDGPILVDMINGQMLNTLIATAWVANVPTTLVGHAFDQVIAESAQLNGNLNGIYWDRWTKYLSKTRSQQVAGHFVCTGKCSMMCGLRSEALRVGCDITTLPTDGKSSSFNVQHFYDTALRKDMDQIISGQWNILEVTITGDINNVAINNLTVKDLVLTNANQNIISAPTFVSQLHVRQLECYGDCKIQDIDVLDWYIGSVPPYGNVTINGVTYIEDSSFVGDLTVQGLVNGIQSDAIVTKSGDQQLNGLVIVNGDTEIERLTTDAVNGNDVKNLRAIARSNAEDIVVQGALRFSKPLFVDSLMVGNSVYGVSVSEMKSESDMVLGSYAQRVNEISKWYSSLTSTASVSYIKTLEYRQTLTDDVVSVGALELNRNDRMYNLLVVASRNAQFGRIQFYTWNDTYCRFVIDPEMLSLKPVNEHVSNMQIVNLFGIDHLVVETYDQTNTVWKQTFFPNVQVVSTYSEFYSNNSRTFLPLRTKFSSDCLLAITDQNAFLEIVCAVQNDAGFHLKTAELIEIGRTSFVTTISPSGYSDRIITLDTDRKVQVYSQYERHGRQTIDVHGASCVTAIEYQSVQYIAICSDNARTLKQLGSIEIYKATQTYSFSHVQTINIGNPTYAHFSVVGDAELALFVVANHPTRRCMFFTLAGFSGFSEFQEFPSSSKFIGAESVKLLSFRKLRKEFVSIISQGSVSIVEAVLE